MKKLSFPGFQTIRRGIVQPTVPRLFSLSILPRPQVTHKCTVLAAGGDIVLSVMCSGMKR